MDARRHIALLLPAHDEKTDAVLLYSEHIVTVQSLTKSKHVSARSYKILRPSGRDYGMVVVSFNAHSKVTALRGWCIPAQGKDYEIKDKEAIEISIPKVDGSELISDVKDKVLQIPAADPETSSATSTKSKSSRWSCRACGNSSARFRAASFTTPFSFLPAGSSELHGLTTPRAGLPRAVAINGIGPSATSKQFAKKLNAANRRRRWRNGGLVLPGWRRDSK